MSSPEPGDEVREFLKRLRDFMPDDLLLEILRLYGLRDVLAYAMNLDKGTGRIKKLIEEKMGIEYIKMPHLFDKMIFNRDNQRVYGMRYGVTRDPIELELESLSSDISERYEVEIP